MSTTLTQPADRAGTASQRGADILAVMQGYPTPTTVEAHIAYAHALADLGIHVAVIHTFGEKLPFDLRTPEQKAADEAAGRSKKSWYLATTDKGRLTDYITEAVRRTGYLPNLGMHLGPSRMIAVDNDHDGDTCEWTYSADLRGEPTFVTVLSPGKYDQKTQQWVHWDGTHIYYTVPERVDVSTLREVSERNVPENSPRGGWVVKSGAGLGVMLPPSIRQEGQYRLDSRAEIIEAPATLLEMLTKPAPVIRDYDSDDDSVVEFRESVDDAMRDVSWSDILSSVAYPDGNDSDGCEIWTRPGGARKSFVAHTDCPTLGGRTCLVVHSSSVPNHDLFEELSAGRGGGKAFSKWEALAVLHFDGDMSAAAKEYGFSRPSKPSADWSSVFVDESKPFAMSREWTTLCPHGDEPGSCVPCLRAQSAKVTAEALGGQHV